MRRLKNALFFGMLSMLFVLSVASVSWAVSFSRDFIYLYEDGKPIDDDSVVVVFDTQTEICKKGRFERGQQYSNNLVFYKTNDPHLVGPFEWFDDFISKNEEHHGPSEERRRCEEAAELFDKENGDLHDEILARAIAAKTKNDRDSILRDWQMMRYKNLACFQYLQKEHEVYFQNAIDHALYRREIEMPAPEMTVRKTGNPLVPMTGNDRIGMDRCLNVDIKTGEVQLRDHCSSLDVIDFGDGRSFDPHRVTAENP